jgi:hypothetical protein
LHPERNVRSFLRTWVGQFLPRRFWRQIRPEQPVNVRRLLMYWSLVAVTMLMWFAAYVIANAAYSGYLCQRNRAVALQDFAAPPNADSKAWFALRISEYGSFQAYIETECPKLFSARYFELVIGELQYELQVGEVGLIVMLGLAALAWPWMTLLAMLAAFRISLRRAKSAPGTWCASPSIHWISAWSSRCWELRSSRAGMSR